MAGDSISRRALVSGITAGATVALAGAAALAAEPALAADARKFTATAGPCGLWPGHSLRYQFFLPAVQRGRNEASTFTLTLKTLDGQEFVSHTFQLEPGTGTEVIVDYLRDGSILVNGELVRKVSTDLLVVIAIIAILIGLLLPAVQKVMATSTSFVPGRPAGAQNVDYILPFVEQDN